MKDIRNIIFDLGGVLLNIDYDKTSQAFKRLGVQDFDTYYTQTIASPLFEDLETGKITQNTFFEGIRQLAKKALTNEQITIAWNAMLQDFPIEHFKLLQSLQLSHQLFLYSNTNSIHYDAFQQIFRKATGNYSLDDCFNKAYYSHLLGYRKPNPEGFQIILKENNLIPQQTLFVDDTLLNTEAANTLGLRVLHTKTVLKDLSIM